MKKLIFLIVLAVLASLIVSCQATKMEQEKLEIVTVEGKSYGDAVFSLKTTGGSGNGAVTFKKVSGDAATVTAEGLVTITAAGDISVKAEKKASGNYKAASSQTVTISFGKKLVKVEKPTVVNKIHQNTAIEDIIFLGSSEGYYRLKEGQSLTLGTGNYEWEFIGTNHNSCDYENTSGQIVLTVYYYLISLDTPTFFTVDDLDNWYDFTVEKADYFQFSIDGDILYPNYVWFEIYDIDNLFYSLNDEKMLGEESDGNDYLPVFLKEGDYRVKFCVGNIENLSFKVTSLCVDVTVGDNDVLEGTNYFRLNVPTSGIYEIETTESAYIALYDSAKVRQYGQLTYYSLSQKTYFILVNATISCKLEISSEEISGFETFDFESNPITNSATKSYQVDISEPGVYSLELSGNSSGYLYAFCDSQYNELKPLTLNYYGFNAGTYYLFVSVVNPDNFSVSLSLVSSFDELEPMQFYSGYEDQLSQLEITTGGLYLLDTTGFPTIEIFDLNFRQVSFFGQQYLSLSEGTYYVALKDIEIADSFQFTYVEELEIGEEYSLSYDEMSQTKIYQFDAEAADYLFDYSGSFEKLVFAIYDENFNLMENLNFLYNLGDAKYYLFMTVEGINDSFNYTFTIFEYFE